MIETIRWATLCLSQHAEGLAPWLKIKGDRLVVCFAVGGTKQEISSHYLKAQLLFRFIWERARYPGWVPSRHPYGAFSLNQKAAEGLDFPGHLYISILLSPCSGCLNSHAHKFPLPLEQSGPQGLEHPRVTDLKGECNTMC